ncbi:AzlC family ABC transporter permease [Streptomyces sp. DSM 44915]|uniref:AzlC family ABC transporter permease n=1 Tax=Streptomyces chisholmiae TaxID=3075540 RepID=A0ABU2JN67_9ACTN|nr:AzlC family ABC transporter permease [Streptomyces sp. DSM 44915]MDT0266154.1 AzlC family ABC transporter permease [Streptomyces sp. DSM 44915]
MEKRTDLSDPAVPAAVAPAAGPTASTHPKDLVGQVVPADPRVAAAQRRATVRDALGVGLAVGLSGFAFGVTAVSNGLSVPQAMALSLLVFTGASQFALVGALAGGGNPVTAAAGAFFLGARNCFYGLRLASVLRPSGRLRPLVAHWVIDETSAVALAQPNRRLARLGFLVSGATLFGCWNLTTLVGALGAGSIGDPAAWGLDAASPAVFLALLAPMLRSTAERATAALAVLLALACLPLLPAGVPVLVAALAAPLVLLCSGRRVAAGEAGAADGPGGSREVAR